MCDGRVAAVILRPLSIEVKVSLNASYISYGE
jgi:hypothetical protein